MNCRPFLNWIYKPFRRSFLSLQSSIRNSVLVPICFTASFNLKTQFFLRVLSAPLKPKKDFLFQKTLKKNLTDRQKKYTCDSGTASPVISVLDLQQKKMPVNRCAG